MAHALGSVGWVSPCPGRQGTGQMERKDVVWACVCPGLSHPQVCKPGGLSIPQRLSPTQDCVYYRGCQGTLHEGCHGGHQWEAWPLTTPRPVYLPGKCLVPGTWVGLVDWDRRGWGLTPVAHPYSLPLEGRGAAPLTELPLSLCQQPQPLSVEPKQGPQAGGTMLTINGTHLDTGSEEDVRVTLNDVPCKVWVSPEGWQTSGLPWYWGRVRGSGAMTLSLPLRRQ